MNEDNKEVFFGIVCWFSAKKGMGFLTPDKGGSDMFVHWTDINQPQGFKTLNKDDKVSYGVGANNAGRPKAINVTVIK